MLYRRVPSETLRRLGLDLMIHVRMKALPDPNIIQHIALPLELIGLFLAMLEIFYPAYARALEHRVDGFVEGKTFLKMIPFYKLRGLKLSLRLKLRLFLIVSLSLACSIALHVFVHNNYALTLSEAAAIILPLMVISYLWNRRTIRRVNRTHRAPNRIEELVNFIIHAPTSAEVWTLNLVLLVLAGATELLIRSLNRMGNDQAVGAIGIGLGAVGFIMEFYQVVHIEMHEQEYGDVAFLTEYWSIIAVLVILLGIGSFFLRRYVMKNGAYQASNAPSTGSGHDSEKELTS
jgi:hypothetical protein